jgi:nuclear transport factor 2 (NTF2) superfamily protein
VAGGARGGGLSRRHCSERGTAAFRTVSPAAPSEASTKDRERILGCRSHPALPFRETQARRDEVTNTVRPPFPPFIRESAIEKVRLAEDGWNSRNPEKVALAYTVDSQWRNRAEFVNGRDEIVAFLGRKWTRELDYRLIKELWAFDGARIAVRFAYECHDDSGNWFRSYGNENWEFDDNGLMHHRYACINDLPIKESERLYHWPLGRRPDDHPGLSELGL